MNFAPSGLGSLDLQPRPRAHAAGLCFSRPFGPGVQTSRCGMPVVWTEQTRIKGSQPRAAVPQSQSRLPSCENIGMATPDWSASKNLDGRTPKQAEGSSSAEWRPRFSHGVGDRASRWIHSARTQLRLRAASSGRAPRSEEVGGGVWSSCDDSLCEPTTLVTVRKSCLVCSAISFGHWMLPSSLKIQSR